jgi:glyoxylase-like metal-dependent hydrolase (beta-lactamase superfamily II)
MKPKTSREVIPGVHRFEGELFYGEEVGVYLVELDDRVVLIDIPAFNRESAEFVKSFSKPVEGIATHGPTIIKDTARWQQEVGLRVALHEDDRDDVWIRGVPDRLFSEARHRVGRLEVIHTPGHSRGSVCILDPKTGALFSGDTVAATTHGTIRDFRRGSAHDSDSKQRAESVLKLRTENFTSLLPFHYSPLLVGAREELLHSL